MMNKPLTVKQILATFDAIDKVRRTPAGHFLCDQCGDASPTSNLKRWHGMKLCPECREAARDFTGR